MNRPAAVSILLAALALAGCDPQTETLTYTPPLATPIKTIVTTLDVGDVSVRPSTGAVPMFVEAEAQWLVERPKVTFSQRGSIVVVDSSCADDDPMCRVDLTLSIPTGAALEIRGEETSISATNLDGAAALETAVGDIALDDMAGALDVNIGAGELHGVNLTSAEVAVTLDAGDVALDFTDGAAAVSVTADLGSVSLVVPPIGYHVDASSGAGTVEIGVVESPAATRSLAVHTRSGDVSIQPRPATLDQPFALTLGRTAHFAEESISLTFDGVVEDSRCPTGVLCVWAGRFVAAVTLTSADGAKESLELTLGQPAPLLDYSVELLAATPRPSKDAPRPNEEDYVLTLVVGRD